MGTNVTIGGGSTTAGTTNNVAGGRLVLHGGQGKGSGDGGDIVFQTANAGGSGSTLNSLVTALTISDDLSATFPGAIVGNGGITGDLTGDVSGNVTGTAATVTAGTQAAITTCANLTTVGTIGTGAWNADVIPSAKLDADTAHYSAMRQLTHHMFRADIDTTKTYVGLQEADAESGTVSNKNLPLLAPVAGKLLKIFLRATTNLSGRTLTWTLETHNSSSSTGGTPTTVGTVAGTGCTASSMTTYDFSDPSVYTGDNLIDAGDTVQLGIESSGTTANTTYQITCLWEWNLS